MMNRRRFFALGAASLGVAVAARSYRAVAADGYQGKLIDAHSHVPAPNAPGPKYTKDELGAAMVKAGVDKVVAFGAPPGFDPNSSVIPIMYATPHGGQPLNDAFLAHLKAGRFRGLKTVVRHVAFPLAPAGIKGSATDPFFKRLAELAAATGRPLTIHAEGPNLDDLDALMREFPEANIVLAHLGQRLGKDVLAPFGPAPLVKLIEAHRGFHLDLSCMSPATYQELSRTTWDPVIVAHPTRFLFGMDIFLPSRPLSLIPREVAYFRAWFGRLPPEVAEQVGYKNAERLWLG